MTLQILFHVNFRNCFLFNHATKEMTILHNYVPSLGFEGNNNPLLGDMYLLFNDPLRRLERLFMSNRGS